MIGSALLLLILLALRPDTVRAAWAEIVRLIELKSDPLPASPARLSEHEAEQLAHLEPQKQAELLLERAVNHYEGANEWIAKSVDGWRGRIEPTPYLSSMITAAMNSNDLRVRAAAMEVYLAAYNVEKNSGSVDRYLLTVQDDAKSRPAALYVLGTLGNRGVEPNRVRETLLAYLHDPDEETRHWAVEGLASLGGEEIMRPLLEVFHNDRSARVRERAACSLAQSGMLTQDQRMRAVPELLNYLEDSSLDEQTRGWVYQALGDISGQRFAHQPAPWRTWWSEYAAAHPTPPL